jgi:hypothetical protein
MSPREFSWTPTDRAHERQGEADEDFDAALARETKCQAAAMRSNVLIGHQQTLEGLAESLAHRLGQSGVTETLVRTALSCGVHTTGQMLLDMVGKCIEDDSEIAALVEMERRERAGGLNVAAMRAVAPQEVRVLG